jgi:hypothetical protein
MHTRFDSGCIDSTVEAGMGYICITRSFDYSVVAIPTRGSDMGAIHFTLDACGICGFGNHVAGG